MGFLENPRSILKSEIVEISRGFKVQWRYWYNLWRSVLCRFVTNPWCHNDKVDRPWAGKGWKAPRNRKPRCAMTIIIFIIELTVYAGKLLQCCPPPPPWHMLYAGVFFLFSFFFSFFFLCVFLFFFFSMLICRDSAALSAAEVIASSVAPPMTRHIFYAGFFLFFFLC